jgi:predicted DNA-binding transcriptional regulator YafY
MDLFDRIYCLDRVLRQSRYPVPHAVLQEKLECSRATTNRIIRDMRDFLGAPIQYDRKIEGYHYAQTGDQPYDLPGLWFNASELYALLTVQHLLAEIQPGLLESHIAPLQERIERILKSKGTTQGDTTRRIRILRMAGRRCDPENFPTVAGAVLGRKRLLIVYHGRANDKTTERTISPQRIIHYRDNWYLDAWDHAKKALRSFSVDRILQARMLHEPARDIPDNKLNAHFASAYGIFAGKPKQKAVLRFTSERSRWVADEIWHPKQKGRFEDGQYILEVPYSDSRELVMDILKHGPEVEVLAPTALRTEVRDRLARSIAQYQTDGSQKRSLPGAGSNEKENR